MSGARPARRSRRGLRRALLSVGVLALAAGGAWLVADRAATELETRSRAGVAAALAQGGADWASVSADGLRVRLTGTAPDELSRVRAVSAAAAVVGPSRIVDALEVASAAFPPADLPRIELLRGPAGITVIGTVPPSTDRAALLERLSRLAGGTGVTDLLHPAPAAGADGWDAALGFGLTALASGTQTRVIVTPGKVALETIANGEADRARITAALNRDRPASVTLDAQVEAPRPVISPFILRASRSGGTTWMELCSADSAASRDRLRAASGLAQADCRLGLGMPGPEWVTLAEAGLTALNGLDTATLSLTDRQASLRAPGSVSAAAFDAAETALRAALPPGYTLEAEREVPPDEIAETPVTFTAAVADGRATLSGVVENAAMRAALDGLAAARLAPVEDQLTDARAALPEDWTRRQIAAIEAMTGLKSGKAIVTPELIAITGLSGDRHAGDTAVAYLSHRLGAGSRYRVRIDYDRRLDQTLSLPSGQDCVDRLNAVMAASEITFAANSDRIEGDAAPTLTRLGEELAECDEWKIEIGGHTDSKGSDPVNERISQGRAESVLAALREAGAPVANLTARGYGESRPRADNDTDEGREANRRIEFTLAAPDPVPAPPERGAELTGTTRGGVAAPAPRALPQMADLPQVGPGPQQSATDAARAIIPPPVRLNGPADAPDATRSEAGAAPADGADADTAATGKADTVSASPPQRPESALPDAGEPPPDDLSKGDHVATPQGGFGAGIAGTVPPLLLDQLEADDTPQPTN